MSSKQGIVPIVENFNRNIKALVVDLCNRCPDSADTARLRKRVNLAIDALPTAVIDVVGPYLFRYNKEIYGFSPGVEESFLSDDAFVDDINSAPDEQKSIAAQLVPMVKGIARKMSPREKKKYVDTVVLLLDDFLEYEAIRQGQ